MSKCRFALLLAAVALLPAAPLGAPLGAQEEKLKAAEPVEKTAETVMKLLDRAIARQGPPALTKEGAIKDLTVKIQATVFDYSKKPAEEQSITVSRYLTLSPRQFRSEWKTIADRMISGFDGRRYWYAEYNVKNVLTDSRFLGGDTYESDRKRIQEEIDETRYLLRFFFLTNLKGEEVLFTQKPDEKIDAMGERECHVLHRVNRAKDSSEPPLTLYLDKSNLNLVRATAHATKKEQKSLTFTFRYSEAVQPRVKGVLFPFKMEIHERPFGAKKDRIASKATLLENGIDFNTGLKKTLFRAPILNKKK